ncbi:MAG: hypothetical protein ACXVI9_11655 [Mucilaginibacter sp.]
MKLTLFTFAAALLLPFFSSAQSNYKPGYVVDIKGDTLKGTIDYREWDQNLRQVSFKTNAGAVAVYTPQNARAFAVTGLEYYETHTIRVSQDEVDLNKLSQQLDTNSRTGTYFLHVLTKGKSLILYSYEDALKLRFYLLRSGNIVPEELEYHAYYNSDVSSTIQYINRYRVQLQFAAQQAGVSNGQIESLIQNARYDNGDLVSIVSKINGGSNLAINSKSVFGVRWFAGAAVMNNTLKTEDNIEAPPSHVVLPKISVGIDFLPNKSVQQLVFRGELSFNAGNYSFANSTAYPPFSGHFKQYTISVVPQFLFNFYNADKVKVFIDGGLSFNISQYSDYATVYPAIVLNGYPPLAKAWVSIPLKIGVTLNKKVEIYGGYTPLTNLTTVTDFPVTLTTYQAGINFLFGAK